MPTFTIYSIGDGAFLAEVLNGLAAVCGTGGFNRFVAIGILLGIFAVAIRAMVTATRDFPLQNVLVGFIFYMVCFNTSVTVVVEDVYTQQDRVVDNVPLGPAATGMVISFAGYKLTQIFETGYSAADRTTDQPFADPLKLLVGMRQAAFDSSITAAMDESLGGSPDNDFALSLYNYMVECTFPKIQMGFTTSQNIYQNGIEELWWNAVTYGTRIKIKDQPENVTCAQGAAILQNVLPRAVNSQQVLAAMRRLTSRDSLNTAALKPGVAGISAALNQLGQINAAADQYMIAMIAEPIYKKAAQGFYSRMGGHWRCGHDDVRHGTTQHAMGERRKHVLGVRAPTDGVF